jgi:hypothetical protein
MVFFEFSLSKLRQLSLVFAAVVCSFGAQAQDTFSLTLTVNSQSNTVGFSTVEELFDRLDRDGFQSLDASYTDSSAASLRFGYRGLDMFVTTSAGSQTVTLNIPGIVENKSFTGVDRDASFDLLGDFFESDGGAILSAVMKKLAEVSPVDPIAGNPSSMQSMMVSNDYDATFTGFASNIKAAPSTQSSDNGGLLALALRFGRYSQGGLKSEITTLPLSYTYRGFGEGRQLTFSMPISVGSVGDAKVYQLGLGLAYRHTFSERWSLTPAANLGASGSVDLGSLAAMTAVSLTSQYTIPIQDYELSLGNMIGQYDTLKLKSEDYSYDPGISNTVYRNGIMLSRPVTLGKQSLSLEASFINTQYTGTALYNKWTNELGLTVGTRRGSDLPSYLRAGVTLLKGQRSSGVMFNAGYWF